MNTTQSSEVKGNQPSGTFGIYSAIERRPVIRAWAKGRKDAEAKMASIRAADKSAGREEEEYYVVELSLGDVESYKAGGFIGA